MQGNATLPLFLKPRALIGWVLLCALSATAQPTLLLSGFPTTGVTMDTTITLALQSALGTPLPTGCRLYQKNTPDGNRFTGKETELSQVATAYAAGNLQATFTFQAGSPRSGGKPQLPLGFHYLIAACGGSAVHSQEGPLMVVTQQAATILSPKSEETSFIPLISWTPVAGVPAYHILLSDQAIEIDQDSGTVEGASVIWQAITSESSILYGSDDPSGAFASVSPPPLSPGVPYNLIILNNYDGKSALTTSTKAQSLRLFAISSSDTALLLPPRVLAPTSGDTLTSFTNPNILFRWTDSIAKANTYQLYLYAEELQNEVKVLIPVWQTEVTDTMATLAAATTLSDKRYVVKVFALGASGLSVVGDTASFYYRASMQKLRVQTRTVDAKGDTVALGDVQIGINALEGASDPFPLFTLPDGFVEKRLPWGLYDLTFTKQGYLEDKTTIRLREATDTTLTRVLRAAPSLLVGRTVDAQGLALANATITARDDYGDSVTTTTDAGGVFQLGVEEGSYTVRVGKPGYSPPEPTTLVVSAGSSTDMGMLTMNRIVTTLSGKVSNPQGSPVLKAKVEAMDASGAVAASATTDATGQYSIALVPGSYQVRASRTGFTTVGVSVQLTESVSRNFTLQPGASILTGRIQGVSQITQLNAVSSPLEAARIRVWLQGAKDTLEAQSNSQGDYSLSVGGTGKFNFLASKSSMAVPQTVTVTLDQGGTTLRQDFNLRLFAKVQGRLSFNPVAQPDARQVKVQLLRNPSRELAASISPFYDQDTLRYSLTNIPDGDYLLSAGYAGYGVITPTALTIANGLWETSRNLSLTQSNKTLTIGLTRAGSAVAGSLQLQSPQQSTLAAGTALNPAPFGLYSLNALPTDRSLLPLRNYRFTLDTGGLADTTLTLALPFRHVVADTLNFQNGNVTLVLAASTTPDSVFLNYGYGDALQRARMSLAAAQATLAFDPGKEGGNLVYHFEAWSGGVLYSNGMASRLYRAFVRPDPSMAIVSANLPDTILLSPGAASDIWVNAFDAGGRRLDSLLELRGQVSWRLPPVAKVRLASDNGRTNRLTAPGRIGPSELPHPMWLEVSLDGIVISDTFTVRYLPQPVVNKLRLTSSLAGKLRMDSPRSFSLQVEALDTTTTPPTPMLCEPGIRLIPAEAGTVDEMRVRLHPDFIGPVRVIAEKTNRKGFTIRSELGEEPDSLHRGVFVGQTLQASDSARVLFHSKFIELHVSDSAVAPGTRAVLHLKKHQIPITFSSERGEHVLGDPIEISNPLGSDFTDSLLLVMSPPNEAIGRPARVRDYSSRDLSWSEGDSSRMLPLNKFGRPAVATPLAGFDGHVYALSVASRPLGLSRFDITPNPFSPMVQAARDGNDQYGTRISLHPESDVATQVTTTVGIYNLNGERVRQLVDHQTLPKELRHLYWDGKTDTGRWARNGRYLIVITLQDGKKTRYVRKPVILFR